MSAFYNVDQPPFNSRSSARAIAAANNGLLFDPSDMTTLYQDAAGTIPVTAVEQPVGKMLDKSGNGYHATQSITASRPVLSARYNLLTYSDPNLAVPTNWTVGFATGTYSHTLVDSFIDLGSNHKAVRQEQSVLGRSYLWSAFPAVAGTTYTLKVRFNKSVTLVTSGLAQIVTVQSNSIVSQIAKSVSDIDNDGLITITFTATTTATQEIRIGLGANGNAAGIAEFTGWEIQIAASSLFQYQRIASSTDYDTDPRYFPKYLKFDGVDDYLNLPYISLYVGGEMSIIAARNAVSQSTDTYIISERSTTDADPKYFPSRQLANGGNMDAYIADDAAAVVLDTTGSAFGGAADKVIRSVVDTGSNLKLYKNGALAASDNYTRAGTLTLNTTTIGASVSTTTSNYAKMKLYGLLITKSALTDAQRVRCERFLARKAGVML